MSLLELRDLAVTYRTTDGRVPAVRGVSLRLDEGQTLGIAGESGCGKSTLAAAVLRLLPRTAKVTGEVLFQDEDILTMRWGRLRAVRWAGASIVFQGAMHSLNPVQKIGKQIAEPILLHEKVSRQASARFLPASLPCSLRFPAPPWNFSCSVSATPVFARIATCSSLSPANSPLKACLPCARCSSRRSP